MSSALISARRVLLVARIALTLVGGLAAGAVLVGPGLDLEVLDWALLGAAALILWAVYLPLEFALVVLGCCVVGALWDAGWSTWLADAAPAAESSRRGAVLVGFVSAFAVLGARLETYRRGPSPLAKGVTALVVLGSLGAPLLLDGAMARAVSLQLAASALFATLGADILLFKNNLRGLPNLKHLVGGLWILTYLIGSQIVLLGVVTPIVLLFTRERWSLVRRCCAGGMRFMFDSFPYGRFDREGIGGKMLAEPAVVVSTHQSSVDIPLILSLPADIRLLTSRRVWMTPVLGIGARCLGHVLVESGQPEVTLERCRERFACGASVHGFPEGTRSQGAYPGRFRRGSFEIATDLSVDVLPVVLCNTRTCVARDGFWIGDFWMSVKVLPRVTPQNFDYSSGSNALMKHVQQLMRDEVERENRRIYSDHPFLQVQVAGLYRYQTRATRRRVGRHLREIGGLDRWRDVLPTVRRLLVIESGPGVLSHLLSLPNLRLSCVGWLCDPNQLAVARRSAASNEKLSFIGGDEEGLDGSGFDAVVFGHEVEPGLAQRLIVGLAPGTRVLLCGERGKMHALLTEHGFEACAEVPGGYERVASS